MPVLVGNNQGGKFFTRLFLTLLILIIYAHIITFAINKNTNGTLNRSCCFGLPTHIFP